MKHLQIACILFFSFCGLKAQHKHFLYIQTENKQAFYLKLDRKLYSSSASGYLILPRLSDSTYLFAVGFPKSEWAEQSLSCTISDNDAGYLLKNFENKGWGLFNLQTLSMTMAADNSKPAGPAPEVVNKTDAFSTMLSTVVNDSSIRQTEVVKAKVQEAPKETAPPATVAAGSNTAGLAPKEEILSINKEEKPVTTPAAEKPAVAVAEKVQEAIPGARSVVNRQLLNTSAEGTEMVYVDEVNGKKDTIRVFIPADKTAVTAAVEKTVEDIKQVTPAEKSVAIDTVAAETRAPVVTEKAVAIEKSAEEIKKPAEEVTKPVEEAKQAAVKEEKPGNTKFLDIEVMPAEKKPEASKPAGTTVAYDTVVTNPLAAEPVHRSPMINSDCKSVASDDDFMKLRKKMAAETDDDDMILLAKKIFKLKCFTVEQVKNLSVLFLKDAGKYSFFDMAYPRVSDSHNFSTLQGQLSDPYYINRFQSMIRH